MKYGVGWGGGGRIVWLTEYGGRERREGEEGGRGGRERREGEEGGRGGRERREGESTADLGGHRE